MSQFNLQTRFEQLRAGCALKQWNEGFRTIEDINNILNTGEVPNLFASDERAECIECTRPLAKQAFGKKAADILNEAHQAKLLSAGPYKERYRKDMIVWGEARRQADPGFFAREVAGEE